MVDRVKERGVEFVKCVDATPMGSPRQWQEDDSSAIIEIARQQGEVLEAA